MYMMMLEAMSPKYDAITCREDYQVPTATGCRGCACRDRLQGLLGSKRQALYLMRERILGR